VDETQRYELARNRVEARVSLKRHLWISLIIGVVLGIINLVTDASYLWFLWPAGGMALGCVIHLYHYFFSDLRSDRKEQLIQKELERMG